MFVNYRSEDAAQAAESIAQHFFKRLKTSDCVEVLGRMSARRAAAVLELIDLPKAVQILRSMPVRSRRRLLDELSPGLRYRLEAEIRVPASSEPPGGPAND
ncbi:magnesium transporter MgtE N-terminal domain-containing protein [Actinomadura latina]|uniref:Magnesium transporter MgtE intracellular domain-containing protein n=1 Tax=Actinomadura latina TaxID=163603 RepID=A0A846YVF7_9ACTN|nr:hypothetical protein [Actinomadura latina]NKZ02665.1 hypothetical protein [Actinomadura latina]